LLFIQGFSRGTPHPFGTPLLRGGFFPLNILRYRISIMPIPQDKELICYKEFRKRSYGRVICSFYLVRIIRLIRDKGVLKGRYSP